MNKDKFDKYPKTDVFQIVDSVTLPHDYSFGAKLQGFMAVNYEGNMHRLGIKEYEKIHGPGCCVEGCNATIDEHVVALVVEVDHPGEPHNAPGLQKYLQSCMELAEKDGATGFSYIRKGDNEKVQRNM